MADKTQDTKNRKAREDPVATALTAPDTPVGSETSTAVVPAPRGQAAPAPSRGVTDSVVGVASDAAHVVQRVLPHRTPVYLGGVALLVLGVADLPVVAGGAIAYEALRRWHPASR